MPMPRCIPFASILLCVATSLLLFDASPAAADHLTCFEPPDCIGLCICQQKIDEHKCFHDYQDGTIDESGFQQCTRAALHAQISCFKVCAGAPGTSATTLLQTPTWMEWQAWDKLAPSSEPTHDHSHRTTRDEPAVGRAAKGQTLEP